MNKSMLTVNFSQDLGTGEYRKITIQIEEFLLKRVILNHLHEGFKSLCTSSGVSIEMTQVLGGYFAPWFPEDIDIEHRRILFDDHYFGYYADKERNFLLFYDNSKFILYKYDRSCCGLKQLNDSVQKSLNEITNTYWGETHTIQKEILEFCEAEIKIFDQNQPIIEKW